METNAPQQSSDSTSNKKGTPTPSRKEAQAARKKNPLIGGDKKAANKQARERYRMERAKEMQALRTNDEANLPIRDRGPVRKYIRNYVDARRNFGEYLLIAAIVFILITIISKSLPNVALYAILGLYGLFIISIVDTIIMWRQLKKRLINKFGQDAVRGTLMYAVTRSLQLRRMRLPKPVVKHGASVD